MGQGLDFSVQVVTVSSLSYPSSPVAIARNGQWTVVAIDLNLNSSGSSTNSYDCSVSLPSSSPVGDIVEMGIANNPTYPSAIVTLHVDTASSADLIADGTLSYVSTGPGLLFFRKIAAGIWGAMS